MSTALCQFSMEVGRLALTANSTKVVQASAPRTKGVSATSPLLRSVNRFSAADQLNKPFSTGFFREFQLFRVRFFKVLASTAHFQRKPRDLRTKAKQKL
ncbi:hypothetical protein [Pseudomonas sp. AMR01]|uniref:hypothetical protein n=1 Tax=Pseudomonas sp. AMR01 TaxID=3064904 RepID=UPI0035BF2A74